MYKLVRQKKRNIVLKVILAIVAFAAIKELVFVLLSPAPVSRQLDDVASSINKRCPLVIDSLTTLSNCAAMTGNRLHFSYQLQVDREEIDTFALMTNSRESMLTKIRTDPNMTFFKNKDISLSAAYYDKTGQYVCGVTLLPRDLRTQPENLQQ